jgi:hypothetical protein
VGGGAARGGDLDPDLDPDLDRDLDRDLGRSVPPPMTHLVMPRVLAGVLLTERG